MPLLDIHTHRPGGLSILNAYRGEHSDEVLDTVSWYSAGIHPWYLSEEDAEAQLQWVKERIRDLRVVAIGECGLDAACPTPMPLQMRVFRTLISLSEQNGLPMILHVVRTSHLILQLRKELRPRQPWVIHGFRGHAMLAASYLSQGCMISIGAHFQEEVVRQNPLSSILLETDDSECAISDIYTRVADILSIPTDDLQEIIRENAARIFTRWKDFPI